MRKCASTSDDQALKNQQPYERTAAAIEDAARADAADDRALTLAEERGVQIREYQIIYKLTDDITLSRIGTATSARRAR